MLAQRIILPIVLLIPKQISVAQKTISRSKEAQVTLFLFMATTGLKTMNIFELQLCL